jgi:hypothetical protein
MYKIKIIPLESTMFELFSDIYFVVYKLYYVGQNDDISIRVSLKNWDRGSIIQDLIYQVIDSLLLGCVMLQ